ncbi:DUF4058 family protein [Alienimonas chondri]|uniref:DUF4058 family protein n=1 Tax=Alienimonas chondri TaxID=2681879 RepID=A0ABX1VFH4_9PLAN|nr:DUF4058 family protein [Alienimonas chondri]NNJ26610.1 hypothetical protein [Alienimonas chondri]
MPVHDFTRLPGDAFRGFHNAWLTRLYDALNDGVMPEGYYAMLESETGEVVPDLLALHAPTSTGGPSAGLAVATAPPPVAERREYRGAVRTRTPRKYLAVRRNEGGRLVALIEIVSRANKDRPASVAQFVGKVVSAVEAGVHVLVIDLYPPTASAPDGLPAEIGAEWSDVYQLDPATPLTLASYVADDPPVAYLQPLAVGDDLPDMPLFLDPGHYVTVPLGATYAENVARFPPPLRRTLEG